MSHKSNPSGRVLQPEIPLLSTYAENPPKRVPSPLTLAPMESTLDNGTGPKGFWPFKRQNSHRTGPKHASVKRGGPRAPPLERSMSEPNSPTEPSSGSFHAREGSESRVSYIIEAHKLLEESKVRFDENRKAWEDFHERYRKYEIIYSLFSLETIDP
ncbi:hypothetical protein NP233_g4750 [Leucocoprinus birnbaumii]|uniref:Uncharacterized protein n=1 Tax=Leucocoprinus birnbaumii TaxID=56174 RepID=A0AAD5VU88_9AGAR|nr:hypothetical protein NP233_g4750 [Leucocoprinus birnbaumii]